MWSMVTAEFLFRFISCCRSRVASTALPCRFILPGPTNTLQAPCRIRHRKNITVRGCYTGRPNKICSYGNCRRKCMRRLFLLYKKARRQTDMESVMCLKHYFMHRPVYGILPLTRHVGRAARSGERHSPTRLFGPGKGIDCAVMRKRIGRMSAGSRPKTTKHPL